MGKKVNFEKIKSNIDKIIEVISTIKKISFLERNQFKISRENISEMIKDFLKKKECNNVLLKVKKDVEIDLNKDLFFLILENLFWNANKYKEENSKIKIEISDNSIIFENKATETLKNKELLRLVQRFYQADNSRLTKWSGLWLAMVDEAIKILWWKIKFESKNKIFTVRIWW